VSYRVITGYRGLRRSLPNLQAAFYVTELLREGTRDLDPHPELFDATVETLETLELARPEGLAAVVLHYELGYLREAGFQPELRRCVRCGRAAPASGPVRFSHAQGGLLCRSCVVATPAALTTLRISTRRAFDGLLDAGSAREAADLPLASGDRKFMRAFMTGILERVLEKELKSTAFLPDGRSPRKPRPTRR
jgi:DNA repair protein RecO (recombination protein O)